MNVTIQNGKAIVNGVTYENVNSLSIDSNGNVVVNGSNRGVLKEFNVQVQIMGDVGHLENISGDVSVAGNIGGNVKTASGDVEVRGFIEGDVKTVSGDVSAKSIAGSVTTVSGDIN